MKKLLILSSDLPKKPNVIYHLTKELTNASFLAIATTYTHIAIELNQEKGDAQIYIDAKVADIDCVYFRMWSQFHPMSVALARLLAAKKILFVNSDVGISTSDDKSYDYCSLYNEVPLPKTIIAYPKWLIENSHILESSLKYPFILKASNGKMGKDNYLITKSEDIKKSLKDYDSRELFCVQEFIPNDFDYRIVVIGSKARQAYIRTRDPKSHSHLNNASQGASKTIVSLKSIPHLCTLAEKAAKILHREISGIDIVTNTKSKATYILEVNSSPSLPYKETLKMIHTYLAKKLL